jgi:hypothetical protein
MVVLAAGGVFATEDVLVVINEPIGYGDAREALIMTVVNRVSEREYRELVVNEPDRLWELWDGIPREKSLTSMLHNDVAAYLGAALINQLDPQVYRVNINGDRVRISARSYYIPDVMVIPAA